MSLHAYLLAIQNSITQINALINNLLQNVTVIVASCKIIRIHIHVHMQVLLNAFLSRVVMCILCVTEILLVLMNLTYRGTNYIITM